MTETLAESTRTGFDPTGAHDPLVWLAVFPPIMLGIAWFDGLDALFAVPVGLAAAWLMFILSGRDMEVALASGAAAVLFVSSMWSMLGALALIGIAWTATRYQRGWMFVLVGLSVFLPDIGVWSAMAGIAFLAAWPVRGRGEQQLVLPFLGAALAIALGAFADPWWAGLVGLAAGAVARALCRHPANLQSGRLIANTAAVGAAAPPLALFVLSALDRAPPLPPAALAGTAFGMAAVGVLVYAYGQGAELALRATEEVKALLVTGGVVALAGVLAAGVADGLDSAAVGAATLWPLAALAIGPGVVRWSKAAGLSHVLRVVVWGIVLVLALAARLLR